MSNWTLSNYQGNTNSGFAGAAFQDSTGEIVIASRGTEPSLSTAIDFLNDAQIYTGWSEKLIGQMGDAESFVRTTLGIDALSNYNYSNVSFTGHSLGGGLTEYLAYMTGANAMTFNAVGVG